MAGDGILLVESVITFVGVGENTVKNFTIRAVDDDFFEGNLSYILRISSDIGEITSPVTTEVIVIDEGGR